MFEWEGRKNQNRMGSVSSEIISFEYEKQKYRIRTKYKFSKDGRGDWLKVKDSPIYVSGVLVGEEKLLKHIREDVYFPSRDDFNCLIRWKSRRHHEKEINKIYEDRDLYEHKIRLCTESADLSKIDGIEKRGKDYSLDHIFPIKIAFEYNLPVTLISSLSNLQILPNLANLQKGNKITPQVIELVEMWKSNYKISKKAYTEIMEDYESGYLENIKVIY